MVVVIVDVYTIIQSSKGFKSGIKKWKIKIDPMLQFDTDMEQVEF